MPSLFVPSVARYQSPTMSTPSGLSDGTRITIVFARIARASASSLVTSRCASTSGVTIPPTSSEWMLEVTSTMSLPFRTSESRSCARRRRGSAIRRWISRHFGRFAMTLASPMNAAMNGRPSVVLPSVRTVMRGLAASSLVKYSTT